MKNTLKVALSALYYPLLCAKRVCRRLFTAQPDNELVILYYHGVPNDSRRSFARQMDAVTRNAKTVVADYTGTLEGRGPHVAVTFDDAYESLLENALPELESRSIPATIFVPADILGASPTWDIEARSPDRNERVMSADQLLGLSRRLIQFGAHTLNHPRLTTLEDPELRREIQGSREKLERLLGSEVTLFSFPYGDHDARVDAVCRQAGYTRLFGILPQTTDPRSDDFVRGRVSVCPSDGRLEFFLKMRGAYDWMPHVSKLKARIRETTRIRPLRSGGEL